MLYFNDVIKNVGILLKREGFKKAGKRKWALNISDDVQLNVELIHMNTALQRGSFEIEVSASSYFLTQLGNPEMGEVRWPYAKALIGDSLLSERMLPNNGRSIPIPESLSEVQPTIELITEPLLSIVEVFRNLINSAKIVEFMYSSPYTQGVGPSMVVFLYRKVKNDPKIARHKTWPNYREHLAKLDPEWNKRSVTWFLEVGQDHI